MDVRFEEQYLEDLYLTGKTNDKKHRFQPQVVQNYRDRIDELMNVGSVRELRTYNALGLEKLSGKKKGTSSIRVDDKYRIEFKILRQQGQPPVTTICNILKLSNHYKK